jgi:ech hydrogenase subunit A
MDMVLALVLLPIIASLVVLVSSHARVQYSIIAAVLFFSSLSAFSLYTSMGVLTFHIPSILNTMIVAADVVLLLFFLYQGKLFNHPKVMLLAAVQLVLYGYIESIAPEAGSAEIMVDSLSKFMFLIINGVGGIIVLYSVKYMEDEPVSPLKKRLFVGGLLIFLSVMNLIVIANSILLFFFFLSR